MSRIVFWLLALAVGFVLLLFGGALFEAWPIRPWMGKALVGVAVALGLYAIVGIKLSGPHHERT